MRTGKGTIGLLAAAGLVTIVGCANPKPPVELQRARTALSSAQQSGVTGELNPTDLHVAEQTLRRAEASFDDDGDSQHTKSLAYAAERQVRIAESRARTIAADRQRQAMLQQIERNRIAALANAQQQLQQTKEQASQAQMQAEAERRAKQAAEDLAKIAAVKQDQRGMVVTLSGSVLFASNKSELLPAARRKLTDVAKALAKDKDSQLIVEGHTDSSGTEEHNQTLSQQRAESVRSFLVEQGIDASRVKAEGHGESQPIADNKSPEGRANNRRVEIVVRPTSQESGQQQQQQQQQQQPSSMP